MAVIREATEADLPRLMALLHQLSQLGEGPESVVRDVAFRQTVAFQQLQSSDRSSCLVLEEDRKVVGTVTIYVLPALSHDGRPFAIVENVVVDESVRRKGMGRQLMQDAERVARERGCYKVSFTSNARRTDAHAFYERLGFSPSHRGYSKYFD